MKIKHPAGKKTTRVCLHFKGKSGDEIENGYLSLHYASIKYHVSPSALKDWRK